MDRLRGGLVANIGCVNWRPAEHLTDLIRSTPKRSESPQALAVVKGITWCRHDRLGIEVSDCLLRFEDPDGQCLLVVIGV